MPFNIRLGSGAAPDHDNYHAAGPAWKDRINGVADLSAQIGKTGRPFTEAQRMEHQGKLLDARLNTCLDTICTPALARKKQFGPFQASYTKVFLPGLRDARVLPARSAAGPLAAFSFNETRALAKLKGDFARCDKPVRDAFLAHLAGTMESLRGDDGMEQAADRNAVADKLAAMYISLQRIHVSPDLQHDAAALGRQKALIASHKAEFSQKRGMDRLRGEAALLLDGASGKQRDLERKMKALADPSRYERHIVDSQGAKVSDRPLYVEELKNRRRGAVGLPGQAAGQSVAANPLQSKRDAQDYTEREFGELASAIRDFQASTGPDREQALQEAVRPILRSKERAAVHRFIREMTRQLKRAGVPQSALADVQRLLPDQPPAGLKLMQSMVPGTGKQMRLQDEAERMAKALPLVLDLVSQQQAQLRDNLMSFDFSGMQALLDDMQKNHGVPSAQAIAFLASSGGRAFVRRLLEHVGRDGGHADLLKQVKAHAGKPELLAIILRGLPPVVFQNARGEEADVRDIFAGVAAEHPHLFMKTSDREFWEREAVDKVGTALGGDGTRRIYKQMQLRAAALGMDEWDVRPYMAQGIANTLRSRNMVIEGTKIGGTIGAATGNLLSTPLSVPAAQHAPVLAMPGLLDTVLMPAGWAVGLVPGAAAGGMLWGMKQGRLEEAKNYRRPVPVQPLASAGRPAAPAGYTSASKAIGFSGKTLLKRADVEKPALSSMHLSPARQFGQVHQQVWKDMGKEALAAAGSSLKYLFHGAPRDIWRDLVVHRGPGAAVAAAPAPAAAPRPPVNPDPPPRTRSSPY